MNEMSGSEAIFSEVIEKIVQAGYYTYDYDNDQLMQLAIGVAQGIDISQYIHPGLEFDEMLIKRIALILDKVKEKFNIKEIPTKIIEKFEKASMDKYLININKL